MIKNEDKSVIYKTNKLCNQKSKLDERSQSVQSDLILLICSKKCIKPIKMDCRYQSYENNCLLLNCLIDYQKLIT
jgi:hypothetical protein